LGEKVVMRLLDKGEFGFKLTTLGFEPDDMEIFKKIIRRPYGIIIVSGPTGSGKSTSLHAALKEIEDIETNIVTVEDPVEYRVEGVTQIETKEQIGLTFGSALRSVLRQDPDIVLIGEIRDEETADIAIKFSLTGHLFSPHSMLMMLLPLLLVLLILELNPIGWFFSLSGYGSKIGQEDMPSLYI